MKTDTVILVPTNSKTPPFYRELNQEEVKGWDDFIEALSIPICCPLSCHANYPLRAVPPDGVTETAFKNK